MDIFDVVDRIRGPKGSTANLMMRRAGEEELLEFNVVRDRIEIISVESTVLPDNVGYVAVSTFSNEKKTTRGAPSAPLSTVGAAECQRSVPNGRVKFFKKFRSLYQLYHCTEPEYTAHQDDR